MNFTQSDVIKAGAELIGHPAGAVRAPLQMPTTHEMEQLKVLIDNVQAL